MNYASLSKSDRLIRVYKLLKTRKEYSTLDIIYKAKVCAVNSIISELRAQGKKITCKRKQNKWFYRMAA